MSSLVPRYHQISMSKNSVARQALWLLLTLGGAACTDPVLLQESRVREALDRELAVGSGEWQIKRALDSVGCAYSYDDFYNCYAGTIPASRRHDGGWKSVIWIRAYMDDDRKFTQLEVETIFTHR
jgi:hypothetical protein